jgi:hypothetical protein
MYTRPEVKINKFNVEDIITASGLIVSSDELKGASAEMYNVYTQNSAAKNTNVSVFTW